MLKIQTRLFECLLFLDALLFTHGWWGTIRSSPGSTLLPLGHRVRLRETTGCGGNPCITQDHVNVRVMAWHTQAQHLRNTLRTWKNIMIRLTNLIPSTGQRFPYVHFSALFNVINRYFCNLIIYVSHYDTIIAFLFSLSLPKFYRKAKDFSLGDGYSCK